MAAELTELVETPLSFDVSSTIRTLQLQNGCRSRDFNRYREYCARKLGRVRHTAKLLKKQKSQHNAEHDVWISILLAERAWAYAEELEIPGNTETEQRRRIIHAKKRLKKACSLTYTFLKDIKEYGSFLTQTDVQAYHYWMQAESDRREFNFLSACEHYGKAKCIYQMLQTLEVRPNAVLVSKIEEIDVRVHLCESNLEEDEYTTFIAKVEEFQQNDIQNLKDGILGEDQDKAKDFVALNWLGEQILLTEGAMQTAFEHINSIKLKIKTDDNPEKIASRHLKLMSAFFTIQNDPKIKSDPQIVAYADFHFRLHNILRYWVILTEVAVTKSCRPHELEERWKEFKELLVALGRMGDTSQNQQLQSELKAYEIYSDISIGYLVGMSHSEAGNHTNAFAIGDHVSNQSTRCLSQLGQISFEILPNLTPQLQKLHEKCLRLKIFGKTGTVIQSEEEQQNLEYSMGNLDLKKKKVPCLKDRKYELKLGNPEQQFNLIEFPLALQTLLSKPAFLDMAHMQLDFPDLSERVEAAKNANKGVLGSIFGW